MLHLEAKKMLTAYLDGELNDQIRQNLEKHLAVCVKCRTELEEYRQFSRKVHELPPLEEKPGLYWDTQKKKILDKIQQPESSVNQSAAPSPAKSQINRWEWATATVSVMILVGAFAYYQFNGRTAFDAAVTKAIQTPSSGAFKAQPSSTQPLAESTARKLDAQDTLASGKNEVPMAPAPVILENNQAEVKSSAQPESITSLEMKMDIQPESTLGREIPPQESFMAKRQDSSPKYKKDISSGITKGITESDRAAEISSPIMGQSYDYQDKIESLPRVAQIDDLSMGRSLSPKPRLLSFRFNKTPLSEALETVATTAQVRIITLKASPERAITLNARNRGLGQILAQIGISAGLPYQTKVGTIYYLTPEPFSQYVKESGHATPDQKVGYYPKDWEMEYPPLAGKTGTQLCPHCRKIPVEPDWKFCPIDGANLP